MSRTCTTRTWLLPWSKAPTVVRRLFTMIPPHRPRSQGSSRMVKFVSMRAHPRKHDPFITFASTVSDAPVLPLRMSLRSTVALISPLQRRTANSIFGGWSPYRSLSCLQHRSRYDSCCYRDNCILHTRPSPMTLKPAPHHHHYHNHDVLLRKNYFRRRHCSSSSSTSIGFRGKAIVTTIIRSHSSSSSSSSSSSTLPQHTYIMDTCQQIYNSVMDFNNGVG